MTPDEAVRLCAALAQCEMALVRRDAVAPALLAQAARHAEGLPPGPLVAAAARLARGPLPEGAGDDAAVAARKAAQALCRAALQEAEAALLGAAR
ncbi:hypothetical protein [Miltoncostaea marina]|uniref:hypothetical protein n=1 Tax=Miltoncostaea marina TaxID=2843215 RepID=UPI001C3C3434|nr:hypothetical protein [Miltoncostaea marina]